MMLEIGNIGDRLRSRFRGLPTDLAWHMSLNRSFMRKARGARILAYHGVCRNNHLQYNTIFTKLNDFEAQLVLYKKYFNIISLDDFYEQRFSNSKFNICLSFDDGFANNYEYVLPLLEKHEIPAAFFVTGIRDSFYDILWNDVLSMAYRHGPASFTFKAELFKKGSGNKYVSSVSGNNIADILRTATFDDKREIISLLQQYKYKAHADYWMQMTSDQIRALSSSKWVTIGSHGYYHNDLAKIPEQYLTEELVKSKTYLERITGSTITSLAFPYGSYSADVIRVAKQVGYKKLLGTEFLFADSVHDKTLHERLTVNPFISNINQMYANIRGKY